MKKILLASFIALAIIGCKSTPKEQQGDQPQTKIIETNLENIDSLSNLVPATWKNLHTIVEGVAHSGKYSSKLDSVNEFSVVYENKLNLLDDNLPKKISISAMGCALKPDTRVLMVFSVNGDKFYRAAQFDSTFSTLNEWKTMNVSWDLPKELSSDDRIKAYVYNKKIGELLVDDIKIELTY